MSQTLINFFLSAKDPYKAKYQLLINKKESTRGLKYLMIQELLLNAQMMWMIFIKILKTTIQIRNQKY